MSVRVTVLLSEQEHAALVAACPGLAIGGAMRELALAQIGIVTTRKRRAEKPAEPALMRAFGDEQVKVPPWWPLVEALEQSAGGHFRALDPRSWTAIAFVNWARAAKRWPGVESWQRLGAWLVKNPPHRTYGFQYGSWVSEQMAFAHLEGAASVEAVPVALKLLEEASRGRFLLPAAPNLGSNVRRMIARRTADEWQLVGAWLAAGGFNWLWEKQGERQATMGHLERWGDAMFDRSASWASAGRPALPAPKLNGISTERAQDAAAYEGAVSAKDMLCGGK